MATVEVAIDNSSVTLGPEHLYSESRLCLNSLKFDKDLFLGSESISLLECSCSSQVICLKHSNSIGHGLPNFF